MVELQIMLGEYPEFEFSLSEEELNRISEIAPDQVQRLIPEDKKGREWGGMGFPEEAEPTNNLPQEETNPLIEGESEAPKISRKKSSKRVLEDESDCSTQTEGKRPMLQLKRATDVENVKEKMKVSSNKFLQKIPQFQSSQTDRTRYGMLYDTKGNQFPVAYGRTAATVKGASLKYGYKSVKVGSVCIRNIPTALGVVTPDTKQFPYSESAVMKKETIANKVEFFVRRYFSTSTKWSPNFKMIQDFRIFVQRNLPELLIMVKRLGFESTKGDAQYRDSTEWQKIAIRNPFLSQ